MTLLDVFKYHPERAKFVLDYHEHVMRGPSPFSIKERELIYAFGSGVNDCEYCHGAHKYTAEAFGVEAGLLGKLLDDIDASPVDDKLKPVLKLVRKLTREPARVTQKDADAVYQAGWDEQAYFDIVTICALHNYMNRLVDGLGVDGAEEIVREAGARLPKISYKGTAEHLAAMAAKSR